MSDNDKLRRLRVFLYGQTVEANEGNSYALGAADITMRAIAEIDRLLAEPVAAEPEAGDELRAAIAAVREATK